MYTHTINRLTYKFPTLKTLLAKATPIRSGDQLAGIAATSLTEMIAAQYIIADIPIKRFLTEPLIDPNKDEVSALILKQHDKVAFASISHLTVGELREYLLDYNCTTQVLQNIRYALTPEMVAAVSKIMRNQDLIAVAKKCEVMTKFR